METKCTNAYIPGVGLRDTLAIDFFLGGGFEAMHTAGRDVEEAEEDRWDCSVPFASHPGQPDT